MDIRRRRRTILTRSYVIMQNGRPVYDHLTEVIDLKPLEADPAVDGDVAQVERLYATLKALQESGEPVQTYVQDAREWLDEHLLATAPEIDDEEGEDG